MKFRLLILTKMSKIKVLGFLAFKLPGVVFIIILNVGILILTSMINFMFMPRPEVIKPFLCSIQLSMKFHMFIKIKHAEN